VKSGGAVVFFAFSGMLSTEYFRQYFRPPASIKGAPMNAQSKGLFARLIAIAAGCLVYLILIYRYGLAWYWAFVFGALVLIVLQLVLLRLAGTTNKS
jgi:hypothetical protein